MLTDFVEAADMARHAGIDPKKFRQALRDAELAWHKHGGRWKVFRDSPEHKDMLSVLNSLTQT